MWAYNRLTLLLYVGRYGGGGREQQQVIKKNKTHTSRNLGVDIWAHFGSTAAAIKNIESPADQK